MRNELSEIEICCRELLDNTSDVLSWNWDDYTDSMLAVMKVDQAHDVSDILRGCFSSQWDFETIIVAPSQVRAIADELGGIRQQQHLFVTPHDENIMAYCAWWPWGDGMKISIRVGLELQDNFETHDAELIEKEFSAWFEDYSQRRVA